jgi:mono/diheme cytochrome c family protein
MFIPFQRSLLLLLITVIPKTSISADQAADDVFENQIRPVLLESCFRCHGDARESGMLRVDSRDALLQGGESGAAIVPGKPEESLLIKAIQRHEDVSAMPPEKDKALRPDQIAAFETWIRSGAQWPKATAKFEGKKHWAFQPVDDVPVPLVDDAAWSENSIDAFIRSRQQTAGVRPAATADKRTLIRRVTFDLIGLPPTPAEVAEFESDTSPNAFEKVVDRLMSSPHYGERWGRHWLDVVRYADTAGETADYPIPLAWRYRNYVIDAFNSDMPYDQFLREQVAGDVLANQRPSDRYAEQVTATGYLAISRRFGFDSENYHHLTIQDSIDTLGLSVLGLSLGCARCHDHKFDPVSMTDYYGLYGIFDSSRYAFPGSEQKQKFRSMVPLLPPNESIPKWREFDQRVATLAARLETQKQGVPAAILRSLNDLDGDFEMQAPAAGGSNGVLVSPWLYEGAVAITNAAQSPFRNLYARGRVGASVAAETGSYRIAQSLYPRRTPETSSIVVVNLDFRIGAAGTDPNGAHELRIGAFPSSPAVVIQITSTSIRLRNSDLTEKSAGEFLADVQAGQWHNLQLTLDLKNRTASGVVSRQTSEGILATPFSSTPLSSHWSGVIDFAELSSETSSSGTLPSIEFDNLGVQDHSIPAAATELTAAAGEFIDPAALSLRLQELIGLGGDFELQTAETAPSHPWNPGPNSVVRIAQRAQSPFQNMSPVGKLGVHMPNRGEYDGFGLTLPHAWNANDTEQLFTCFDFCAADSAAGGDGSWRYYIGHGPGNSAAVELYLNGSQFFRRSGDARDAVGPLTIGEWYQVQLRLDLKARRYHGTLTSRTSRLEFSGDVSTGWDGIIDYSFIDSYGHLGGVRPALDVDNYDIGMTPYPSFDATFTETQSDESVARRAEAERIQQQLNAAKEDSQRAAEELNRLLVEGPFPMAYGMAEGTPHNARIQLRGEPSQPGDEVPRGFVQSIGGATLANDLAGSGRLELANWLTDAKNPLTSRVMVNRIWQYHFGRGLVRTPNDFGVRGLPPSHPELLDHLATRFIRQGWSIKAMHRMILLSRTYQLSSSPDISAHETSKETEWDDLYTHFVRRRLTAEEIRDSILAVCGDLDRTPGREHPFPSPITWGFSQHGPFSAVYDHNKRSVYLMTQRLKRHPFLALFDGPDPNASTADRLGTTVPTQALFFLNDPFVHARADAWAERLRTRGSDDPQRAEQAWLQAYGRRPSTDELKDAIEFLSVYRAELNAAEVDRVDQQALTALLRTLIGSNEFLHVD